MQKDEHELCTVGIGGIAGDGVIETGHTLGRMLKALGYQGSASFTYPSLIRGGHNFARISFAAEKVWSDHEELDILIALNQETITLHRRELRPGGLIIVEQDEATDEQVIAIAYTEALAQAQAPRIARSSLTLGALCRLLNLPLEALYTALQKSLKKTESAANTGLARIGYTQIQSKKFHCPAPPLSPHGAKEFVNGNTAFARGLIAAGLEYYLSYPMTPTTSLLHYLARQKEEHKLTVIQPESELAVINMALGVAYAGKRVAIGSASGGFALMQEAFSLAGMAELPLVVAVSQRQAPATGVPTYSSQTDLRFCIHAGHGEFPRIVVAPGDPAEAYLAGINALNDAWKYQVPVIVLLDKILSEHAMTSELLPAQAAHELGSVAEHPDSHYGRYAMTHNSISPMAFPGTLDTAVKVNSYEHDEKGFTVEDLPSVSAMLGKRQRKGALMRKDLTSRGGIKVSGDLKSNTALLFWGSTKGPVQEAGRDLLRPVKFVQVLGMEPFDTEGVSKALDGVKTIINIEANENGQLAGLVRERTGIRASDMILKSDSRPFEAGALASQINSVLTKPL